MSKKFVIYAKKEFNTDGNDKVIVILLFTIIVTL